MGTQGVRGVLGSREAITVPLGEDKEGEGLEHQPEAPLLT